jgi:hypothetical protein
VVGKVVYSTSPQQTNILQITVDGLGTLKAVLGCCEITMNNQVPQKVGKLSTSLASEKHDAEYDNQKLIHHYRCDRSSLPLSIALLTLLSKPQTWQCCTEEL